VKCVYVDAIASLADEILDIPSSRAEQGWSGSTKPKALNNKHTIRDHLRLSHWAAIQSRKSGSTAKEENMKLN
jgi:hypothetical protein